MKFALTRLVAVEDLGCVLTALKRFTKGALIAMTALILANSHNRQKRPLEKAAPVMATIWVMTWNHYVA